MDLLSATVAREEASGLLERDVFPRGSFGGVLAGFRAQQGMATTRRVLQMKIAQYNRLPGAVREGRRGGSFSRGSTSEPAQQTFLVHPVVYG